MQNNSLSFLQTICCGSFNYPTFHMAAPANVRWWRLLCLQFHAVLPVLLLASIRGLLLFPHKSNDLLHLFGTEVVPNSSKVTFYRIKLFILCFGPFQTLLQIPGRILFAAIEALILVPVMLYLPILPMEREDHLHQFLDERHGLLLPIVLGGLKRGCFRHPFLRPLGVLR